MYVISGTPAYYSEVANLMVDLIQKQRTVIYTDFVRDVAPIAIALRERGLSSWSYHGMAKTCVAMTN